MARVALSTVEGKQMLQGMFGPSMEAEFPQLTRLVKQKPKVAARSRMGSFPTISEDSCNIVADYMVKEGMLRVSGYLYPSRMMQFALATVTLNNGGIQLGQFRYSIVGRALRFEEKIPMRRGAVKKLTVGLHYCAGFLPLNIYGETKVFEIEVAADIVSETLVAHPCKSQGGENVINIIYNRSGQYDYYYEQPGAGGNDNPFSIQIPFAVGVVLDDGYSLEKICAERCEASLLAQGYSPRVFDNKSAIRMSAAGNWQQGNGYQSLPSKFLEECKRKKAYILEFPLDWKTPIEPQSAQGEHRYELSLRAHFTCSDKDTYVLKVDSREFPKGGSSWHEGGNEIEVPYFHILWGCIGKNSLIERSDGVRALVTEIKIGDKIRVNGTGEFRAVANIARGQEELVFYIKAQGMEQGLLLTREHPVLTEKGWKVAGALCLEDKVCTDGGGYRKLEECYPEPYYDEVYSLELAEGEGFMANGYYVGDFKKQNSMCPKREEWPELPPEFIQELEKFKNI